MLTWNQYKKLNENRNLSESVIQKKYQVYLSEIQLNEFLSRNEINQPSVSAAGGGGEVEPVPTPVSTDFIIRINTALGDGLDSFEVGADTKGFTYNYDVAWEEVGNPGNSGTVTGQTESAVISFPSSGQYDISISGLFPAYRALNLNANSSARKVTDIVNWGDNQWQSMNVAFRECQNLNNYSATDTPDLSSVTNMNAMFNGARLFNGDISDWDVSNVTNMSNMFYTALSFNQDLSGWNVSGVTEMSQMFRDAQAFNQDISGWNVSGVTTMNSMFQGATQFNQDLRGWCVSLIPSEPSLFADGAIAWELPKPIWGTCP